MRAWASSNVKRFPFRALGPAGLVTAPDASDRGTVSGRDDPGTVLAVHPSPDGYGADLQMLQTVTGLIADGWRVVVVLPDDGELVPRIKACGAEVQFLAFPVLRKSNASLRALLIMLARAVGFLPRGYRLLRAIRPSVLFVNTVTLPWWLLIGRLTRTPTVAHLHEAETTAHRLVRKALVAPLPSGRRRCSSSARSDARRDDRGAAAAGPGAPSSSTTGFPNRPTRRTTRPGRESRCGWPWSVGSRRARPVHIALERGRALSAPRGQERRPRDRRQHLSGLRVVRDASCDQTEQDSRT